MCLQDGFECVDLGIVRDTREVLQGRMLEAAERCDVVITSGGVSMGDADFVKSILQSVGTVSERFRFEAATKICVFFYVL